MLKEIRFKGNYFFIVVISTFLLFLAAGCGSLCKVTEVDPVTKHFPTGTKLPAQSMKICKKIEPSQYKSLLYIRNTSSPFFGQLDFFGFTKKSIDKLAFFHEIKDKQQIRVEMVKQGYATDTYQINDEMIINWLRTKYDKFLIADYRLLCLGGFYAGFRFNVSDSVTDETVLMIYNKGTNIGGLDQELFYPVFNAFNDWLRDKFS